MSEMPPFDPTGPNIYNWAAENDFPGGAPSEPPVPPISPDTSPLPEAPEWVSGGPSPDEPILRNNPTWTVSRDTLAAFGTPPPVEPETPPAPAEPIDPHEAPTEELVLPLPPLPAAEAAGERPTSWRLRRLERRLERLEAENAEITRSQNARQQGARVNIEGGGHTVHTEPSDHSERMSNRRVARRRRFLLNRVLRNNYTRLEGRHHDLDDPDAFGERIDNGHFGRDHRNILRGGPIGTLGGRLPGGLERAYRINDLLARKNRWLIERTQNGEDMPGNLLSQRFEFNERHIAEIEAAIIREEVRLGIRPPEDLEAEDEFDADEAVRTIFAEAIGPRVVPAAVEAPEDEDTDTPEPESVPTSSRTRTARVDRVIREAEARGQNSLTNLTWVENVPVTEDVPLEEYVQEHGRRETVHHARTVIKPIERRIAGLDDEGNYIIESREFVATDKDGNPIDERLRPVIVTTAQPVPPAHKALFSTIGAKEPEFDTVTSKKGKTIDVYPGEIHIQHPKNPASEGTPEGEAGAAPEAEEPPVLARDIVEADALEAYLRDTRNDIYNIKLDLPHLVAVSPER